MDTDLGVRPFYSFYRHSLTPQGKQLAHELHLNLATGNLLYSGTDFRWQARVRPGVTRYCNSYASRIGPMGRAWSFTYDEGLQGVGLPFVVPGAGSNLYVVQYRDCTGKISPNLTVTVASTGVMTVSSAVMTDFLQIVVLPGLMLGIVDKFGIRHEFNPDGTLHAHQDRNGNRIELQYAGGKIVSVSTPVDGEDEPLIDTFEYTGDVITRIGDSKTNTYWDYAYTMHPGTDDPYLTRVTDPLGHHWDYLYGWQVPETDFHEAIIQVTDPNGGRTNLVYEGSFMGLSTLTDAEEGTRSFAYDTPGPLETTVTDPRGKDWIYEHDADLCLINLTDPLVNITHYEYSTTAGTPVVESVQDARTGPFITLFEDYDSLGNPWKITNALSEVTEFEYNGFSQVTKRTDALSAFTDYDYDSNGNLIKETSPLLYVKEWEYAENGDLLRAYSAQQVADGKNAWTTFTYDPIYGVATRVVDSAGHVRISEFETLRRWVTRTIDPLGQTATFGHDPLGHMTSAVDPLGRVASWTFDGIGNLLEEVSATGASTRYGMDRLNRLITVTNAIGAITHTGYDPNGNELTITDPEGNTTTYTYDDANRVLTATTPLGQVTYMEYDEVGNLTRVIRPVIVDLFRWHDREYDALNRIIVSTQSGSVISVPAPGTEPAVLAAAILAGLITIDSLTREYEFDAVGRQFKTIDPRSNPTETVFDPDGRAIEVINALTQSAFTFYDADGRVLRQFNTGADPTADPPDMEYRYDSIGRKTASIDAAGATTTYEYDALGRVIAKTDPAGQVWKTEFDPVGRVIASINPAGAQRTFGYDDGRLERTTTDPLGNTTTTRFDLLGRRIETISPRGYVNRYAYDLRNRLIERTEPNGARQTRTYDVGGRLVSSKDVYEATTTQTYDAGNRLTRIEDPLSQLTDYVYDTLDRLVEITLPSTDTVATTYDENANHLTETDAAGDTTTFVYDELNRITSRTDSSSQEWLYEYDARGRMTEVTEPNAILLDFAYDRVGRRTELRKTIPASLLPGEVDWVETMRWAYELRGNVSAFMDQNGQAWQYAYDEVGRLATWDDPLSSPAEPRRGQVEYDLAGRIIERRDPIGQRVAYSYNAEDKLTNIAYPDGSTLHYDWSCCRVIRLRDQFGNSSLTYDLKHRLLAQSSSQGYLATYNYDILGRRTRMLMPGDSESLYQYTAWNSVDELTIDSPDIGGPQTAWVSYNPGGMVEMLTAHNGVIAEYVYDISLSHSRLKQTILTNTAGSLGGELFAAATGELLDGVQDVVSTWTGDTYNANFVTRGDGVVLQENHSSVAVPSNLTDYTYDHVGNMLRKTNEVSTIGTDFAFNPASQLTGFENFLASTPPETISAALPHNVVTDRNSNIKRITLDAGDSWIECRYDADNRLVEVVYPEGGPVIELAYDGLNRCVRTRVNGAGVVHVYDGLQRIQDRDERTGDLLAEYTYVQGQLHKWRTPSTEHWVFIEPQGGWPRHLFDDTGALTDSFDVDWNGQELLHQGTTDAPIGWGGGWKLASDTDLPILLMPGTNEIWAPKLGKSLNPLASMSQALPYGTAVGGYTGEVIGLPVRLPVIPSWGSGPGYPWWPGQSGPGGPTQMYVFPEGPTDEPEDAPVTGSVRRRKVDCSAKKRPPRPKPACQCCKDDEVTSPPGAGGGGCGQDLLPSSVRWDGHPSTWPSPLPYPPASPPLNPGTIPSQDDCRRCIYPRIVEARRRLDQLASCPTLSPETLDCIKNRLSGSGLSVHLSGLIWCSADPSLSSGGYIDYACTWCSDNEFGPRHVYMMFNCTDERPLGELAQTVLHELLHACRWCDDTDAGCWKKKRRAWNYIQRCMVYLCHLDCPTLFTGRGHESDCVDALIRCSGLLITCAGAWCVRGPRILEAVGYAVQIWGGFPIRTVHYCYIEETPGHSHGGITAGGGGISGDAS